VIDLTPVLRLGVLLVRPGMVVMLAPGLGGPYAPALVKVGLTLMIALALLPAVQVAPIRGELSLTVTLAREFAIGLALALVTRSLVAAAEFAGHLAGFQIGFSYGATVDPATGVRNTMLASLFGLLAVFTFLAVNGHHYVLRALAHSYEGMPIGAGHVDRSLVAAVGQTLGLVFATAVRLASPVVIVLLIVEVAVGLISRAAPAMSAMVIGYPLRLVIGLAVVAALVGTVPSVVASLVERVITLALSAAAAFR
jgi:flagellar biosynthetic protein FliR